MTTELQAITIKSREAPEHCFQNLAGLLTKDQLMRSWRQLNQHAKPGVDGVTMSNYRENLLDNIQNLQSKLEEKAYRASAIRNNSQFAHISLNR